VRHNVKTEPKRHGQQCTSASGVKMKDRQERKNEGTISSEWWGQSERVAREARREANNGSIYIRCVMPRKATKRVTRRADTARKAGKERSSVVMRKRAVGDDRQKAFEAVIWAVVCAEWQREVVETTKHM